VKITSKKGVQLNQAFGAVLTLILVAVLVIIAIFLFSTLGDTFVNNSQSVTNESIALSNTVNATLAGASSCNFGNDASVSFVFSNGSEIAAANYTAYSNGNIILTNAADAGAGFVSYTYTDGGSSCTATDSMITQFGSYPVLIGLVGTIIFLGLVIGVLVASFVFSGRRV
jgi:hypothetical protein